MKKKNSILICLFAKLYLKCTFNKPPLPSPASTICQKVYGWEKNYIFSAISATFPPINTFMNYTTCPESHVSLVSCVEYRLATSEACSRQISTSSYINHMRWFSQWTSKQTFKTESSIFMSVRFLHIATSTNTQKHRSFYSSTNCSKFNNEG